MTDEAAEEALTLSIVSTLDDQVALALHVANRPPLSTVRRRFEAMMILSVPFIMLIAFFGSWALDRHRDSFGELMHGVWVTRGYAAVMVGGGFAFMALCLLGSRLTRRWWIRINLRRVLKARPDVDPNDPNVSYRLQAVFDSDGIALASATGSSRVHWTAITGLDETPNYFVLLGPSLTAISLAKRAMTEEQADRFRHLVADFAPQAAQSPAGARSGVNGLPARAANAGGGRG